LTAPTRLDELPHAGLLRPFDPSADVLEPDATYDTVLFDGVEVTDPDASGARLLDCAWRSATVTGGTLAKARLDAPWLRSARITGTELADSHWTDGTLLASELAGVQAYGLVARRLLFRGCKLDAVNLRGAALTDVVFDDCVLRDVDFGGAKLTKVRFAGSALHGARFDNVSLRDVDLRGTRVLELASGYDALRGAIIDTAQLLDLAPALAATLGIVVRDERG
jgi:uncharacterized protein YjbI with pentapeptide repeats